MTLAAFDPTTLNIQLAVIAVMAIIGLWLVGELIAKFVNRWKMRRSDSESRG